MVEGPILLHANINGQWGGHTFSYCVEGERSLFWSATEYKAGEKQKVALVGQYPKPGSDAILCVSRISLDQPGILFCNQPLLVRSPDGYLHVFIGTTQALTAPNYSPGKLHYFRSAAPEDISTMIDRTDLLPQIPPYDAFHLRMNVGMTADGKRLALVVLAISADGKVPFNTPVVFFAEHRGPDYVFRPAVRYAEPMNLFYPLVAATSDGAVIVGEVWYESKRATARLLHIDWNGSQIHREDLPADVDGQHYVYDMRPAVPGVWDRLILYHNVCPPKDHVGCRHEFWEYATATHQLRKLRSVPTEPGLANPGRWMPILKDRSVFFNNPSSGAIWAWEGDILGGGPLHQAAVPRTNPVMLGFPASEYVFLPSPLVGSLPSPNSAYLAYDCPNSGKSPKETGPCSFLLFRLKTSP